MSALADHHIEHIGSAAIHMGDCRESLRLMAEQGVRAQMCVTSPPYFGLRDYGHEGQLGLEQTPDEYITAMVDVFRGVRDVLADDGTLWLNLGDSYGRGKRVDNVNDNKRGATANTGHVSLTAAKAYGGGQRAHLREKCLLGMPWRVALALQDDGWYLRQDIIWHKPNPMPESVRDRCTKAHEYLFLLSKSDRYFFNSEAMQEPAIGEETRNRRSVWTVATRPYKGAHFATFPPALIEPCILAGSRPGDVVLDPFMGSGTTAEVALQHKRCVIGCELNSEYLTLIQQRLEKFKQQTLDVARPL